MNMLTLTIKDVPSPTPPRVGLEPTTWRLIRQPPAAGLALPSSAFSHRRPVLDLSQRSRRMA